MAQALIAFAVMYAVNTAISAVFPAEGPRIKDLSVSASTYGNVIPEIWGTVRVGGNMIWSSNIIEHKAEVKAGPESFVDKYTYFADFAMALCRGPVTGLNRIWANGKLIYDASGASPVSEKGQYSFIFYNGAIDQMPDPTIQATVGETSTPAYRGTAYIMFLGFFLTDFGNQIPMIAAEVYRGPATDVPVIVMTNDGTVPLTPGYNTGQMAVDQYRKIIYLNNNNFGLMVIDSTTGILKFTVDVAVGTEPITVGDADDWHLEPNVYDGTGQLSYIYDVSDDGGILTSCGGNNNNVRIVKIDPYSFEWTGTFGHTYPFGTYYDIDDFRDIPDGGPYLDSFMVPLPFSGTCSQGRDKILLNGAFGDLFVVYNEFMFAHGNPYPSGSTKGGFVFKLGSDLTTRIITADVDDGFAIFHSYQDVPIEGMDADTLRVWGISSPWPYYTTLDALIVNPDIGVSTGLIPLACILDGVTGNLLLAFANSVASYMMSLNRQGEIVWLTPLPGGFPQKGYQALNVQSNQVAWVGVDDRLWLIDTTDGTWVNRDPNVNAYTDPKWLTDEEITLKNPGKDGYALPAGTGNGIQYYDGLAGNLYTLANSAGQVSTIIQVNAFGKTPSLLSDIVTDLLLSSGLEPDDFDVTAFTTTTIQGYGYATTIDVKGIIQELAQIYLFDFYERDGKLVGVMRGGTDAMETISYKALGTAGSGNGDDDKADFWKEQRLSEADLPASLNLKYLNTDQDYEESVAVSQRIFAPVPTMFSRQTDNLEVGIALNATDAKNHVNAILYTAWAERTRHSTKLPPAYCYLEPSDLINVNLADGRSYFERIRQTDFGADFSMDTQTNGQDSGAYLFNLTGDGGSGQGQTINPPVPAFPLIFNTPFLRDADSGNDGKLSTFYDAVANIVPKGFNGASMEQSLDNSNYAAIQVFSRDAMWGVVSGIIPTAACGYYAMDWKTKIKIFAAVDVFSLSPITDDELWAGNNMCIIGDEVLQFRDAVDNGDGSWTISNLLRGRRGTEWACDTHSRAEKFTFLDISTISIGTMPLDAKGRNYWFKAVGVGISLADSIAVEIEYEPRDLMPYAPVQLAAAWGSSGLDISFKRRTRLGGNMADGTGIVPLAELTEGYEIDIYAADGVTVLRTLARNFGSTPQNFPVITYLVADIDSDFVTLPTSLTFEIYQMGIVGRGFGTKATVLLAGTPSSITRYWGASALTSLTESDILALGGEDVATDYVKDITYDCTGGKYPYFCFPASYGTPSKVVVNGLPFSAFTVSTVTVESVSYNVCKFDLIQHGSAIPVSWK